MRVVQFLLIAAALCTLGCDDGKQSANSSSSDSPSPSSTAKATEGYWKVDSNTNPVTGSVTTTAYLLYQSGNQNIYVRKKGKKLELYINTDQFLETVENLHSGISSVQYRFDTNVPVRQGWHISADHEALFYPGDPSLFLSKMSKAKTLHFMYQPADKEPQVISFDVTGFPSGFSK